MEVIPDAEWAERRADVARLRDLARDLRESVLELDALASRDLADDVSSDVRVSFDDDGVLAGVEIAESIASDAGRISESLAISFAAAPVPAVVLDALVADRSLQRALRENALPLIENREETGRVVLETRFARPVSARVHPDAVARFSSEELGTMLVALARDAVSEWIGGQQ